MDIKKSFSRKVGTPAVAVILGLGLLGSVTACTKEASPTSEQSNSASANAPLPIANNNTAVNNGKGEYLQTTISNDDPAMKYNEAIVSDKAKDKYDEAELTAAQQAVVKFMAEQTIDSTVQGGGNGEEWLSKNESLIAPDFRDDVKTLLANPKSGFLIDNPNRKSAGYELEYKKDAPRVASRKIDVTKIDLASQDRPQIFANVEYTLNTSDGKVEKAAGAVSYAVTKVDGKWLISGYESKVSIVPFASEK